MKRYLYSSLMLIVFTIANAQIDEICNNGIDDDGDGIIDCEDGDCKFECYSREICDNGIDDDGDGQVDCEDGDCENSVYCEDTQPTEICNNGIDDDNDGFIDYYDGDCSSQLTDLQRDSLALVALYHATDGDNWIRKDNWLTGPLNTWYGVRVSYNARVYELLLNNNQLEGDLPSDIQNLTSLRRLNASDNKLTGMIPALNTVSPHDSVSFRNNYFTSVSSKVDRLPGIYDVSFNVLTFEDLLILLSNDSLYRTGNYTRYKHAFYNYDQKLIGRDTTIYIKENSTYKFDLKVDSAVTDNVYVWFKDSVIIDTTDVSHYTLMKVNVHHSGVYTCQITNSHPKAEEVVLYSHPTTIQVNSTRQPQTIQFDSLSNAFVGDTLLIQASASSELPVIFEVSGPARLYRNQLVLTDTGQVTVTAQQPGDSLYLPAQDVVHTFWVKEATSSEDTSAFYSVSGSVWQKENMPFQRGTVVLYEVKLRYFALYTQELKDSHTYQFDSLPKGNYTIGVLVNDSSYLPTYWGGHYLMLNAEKILVEQDIEELNITLLSTPVIATRGTAIIRGTLIGQKTNNGRLANAESDASLAHVHVYLQNTQGALVAHTVTNEQGEFIFENLPEGAYRFVADYEGVAFPEETIRAIKDQETVITASVAGDINISTEESVDQVTSAFGEIVTKLVKIFPNPVTSTVSVKTDDIQWLGGTISLQNVVGRVVTQVPIQNTITVMDIADQPAGIYLLTIRKNGTVETRKIVKQ